MSNHRIDSVESLLALYGKPRATALKKETDVINETYRCWLEKASFFVIASSDGQNIECTPRGDERGSAFRIVDESTIVIPDRRGNNRLDTLKNIIAQPDIAVLFFIPGIHQTVKVNGRASLTTDPVLLKQFEKDNKVPVCCIELKVRRVFFQNARATLRSGMWDSSSYAQDNTVPSVDALMNSVIDNNEGQ